MNKTQLSRIEKLKAQKIKIANLIQTMEAHAKVSERKKDTRRKILLGSYYLNEARQNNQWELVQKIMDGYLKRNNDRKLFDLPELEETKTE
jgi:hypothetical protein